MERRFRQAWEDPRRNAPIGLNALDWLSGQRPLAPLFSGSERKRWAVMESSQDIAEFTYIVHAITLFDQLIGNFGKALVNNGQSIEVINRRRCGPVHFNIDCSASTPDCGFFPGPIPHSCPDDAFYKSALGISSNDAYVPEDFKKWIQIL